MDTVKQHLARLGLYLLPVILVLTMIACSSSSSGATTDGEQKPAVFNLSLISNNIASFDVIEVQSTHDLDINTVNEAAITVKRDNFDQPVAFNVRYETATKRIIIQPAKALWLANQYVVTLTAIHSNTGESANQSLTISVTANADLQAFGAVSVPTKSYTKNIQLTDARIIRTLYYKAAGADGVWGSSDDVLAQYDEKIYQKSNAERLFLSMGSYLWGQTRLIFIYGVISMGHIYGVRLD